MRNDLSTPPQVTMFFDGACPICKREVAHYKRVDKAARVRWVDISREPELLTKHGLDLQTAMARLHVLAEDGVMHSGVQAFLTLWRSLPYYRWLARTVQVLHLGSLLEWLYVRFARWRLARQNRQACVGTSCRPIDTAGKEP